MCNDLFLGAIKKKMDCPIRVFPKCHPKAHCEVFVDAKHWQIVLTCSKCDRPISTIKVKHDRRTTKGNAQ